jgi:hypothetical protein
VCKSHIFCSILYRHLWPVWLYHSFFTLYRTRNDFRKQNILNRKCVFDFIYKFCLKYFSFWKNSGIHYYKFAYVVMSAIRYSSLILLKLELSRQIFRSSSNVTVHENSSNGFGVVPCAQRGRQTDMTKLIALFSVLRTPLKTSWFMPCREIITVCSAICTKFRISFSG